MLKFLTDAFLVAITGYILCAIYDEWKLRRKYKAFQARCQKRLAEMYAVKRDPYDGRPI